MKTKYQKDIAFALVAIKTFKLADESDKLPNEYKGYISSFGAAMGQSGALPAILFFSEKGDSDTKKNRCKLMKAILSVIKQHSDTTKTELLDYIKENGEGNQPRYLSRIETLKVLDAALAIKMAMRAFENIKSNDNKSE
jgi:CRISPR/Cas system CMR-associated protein Cmr5 small subunit